MFHMQEARKAKREAQEWAAIGHHQKVKACINTMLAHVRLARMARRICRRMGY